MLVAGRWSLVAGEAFMTALRAMTFNIRGFYNRDPANTWAEREALNIATIRRCAPDIIGFQEANGRNVEAYHRALTEYHYVAWPPYNNDPPHQFPAIFWRQDLLKPVACETFWLSETPDVYSGSWETDCIRSAAWIRFRCMDGAEVVHLNTHLDHISEQARVEGARLIVERLAEAQEGGAAAVVTGDFNAPVGSPTYRLFGDAGLLDAHVACGCDDAPSQSFTYHGFEGDAFRGSDDAPRRIDWILLRDGASTKVTARSCEIVRDAEPPVYPSDHYPVLVEVEVT
jgi:endonuclease/exonuclease/phosphatase family metal-dependent hydrolase